MYIIGYSESDASYLVPWKLQKIQRAQHYWIEEILNYKTLFFNIVTIIRQFALHLLMWQLCIAVWNMVCLSHYCNHGTICFSSHMHCFGLNSHWLMSVDVIFSTWRNSMVTHLCLICTTVSDTTFVRLPLCCHLSHSNKM